MDGRGSALVVLYIDIEVFRAFDGLDGGVAFREIIAVVDLAGDLMLEDFGKIISALRLAQIALFDRRKIVAKLIALDSKHSDTAGILEVVVDFSSYALVVKVPCVLVCTQSRIYTWTAW